MATPPDETFSFAGRALHAERLPALPKPVQQTAVGGGTGVPVIVGGKGPRRTPELAARYAAEYNASFPTFDELPGLFAGVRAACERAGRDPGSIVLSAALVLAVGADEAELARRAAAMGRPPDVLRAQGIAGTVQEVVDRLGLIAEAGATRVYLQTLDLSDLDSLDLVAREVVPRL